MGDSIGYCDKCDNNVGCHLNRGCLKSLGPSDTPQTDRMIHRWNCGATHPVMRVRDAVAYARQLEHERDKARTAARKLRDAFATGERLPWENETSPSVGANEKAK